MQAAYPTGWPADLISVKLGTAKPARFELAPLDAVPLQVLAFGLLQRPHLHHRRNEPPSLRFENSAEARIRAARGTAGSEHRERGGGARGLASRHARPREPAVMALAAHHDVDRCQRARMRPMT
jgi:hypothetical protein